MFASPGTIKASSCFLWGIVAVPESLVLPIERISKNTSFVRMVIKVKGYPYVLFLTRAVDIMGYSKP